MAPLNTSQYIRHGYNNTIPGTASAFSAIKYATMKGELTVWAITRDRVVTPDWRS